MGTTYMLSARIDNRSLCVLRAIPNRTSKVKKEVSP